MFSFWDSSQHKQIFKIACQGTFSHVLTQQSGEIDFSLIEKRIRSEEKKSAHVFVCITRIMLDLDKNQSNQQKVHILRIPNW